MKKILFILLSSLVLVSCEGYFDQLPKTELPAETFYTSMMLPYVTSQFYMLMPVTPMMEL